MTALASAPAGRTLFRWLLAGEWRAHPWRAVMSIAAIATGVGLGFAVHLVNATALGEFGAALRGINGDADIQVRAVRDVGFDEALYPKLADREEFAAVSPVVEVDAAVVPTARAASSAAAAASPRENSLKILGIDPLRAATVTPGLIGRQGGESAGESSEQGEKVSAEELFDPDAIFLSAAALAAFGKQPGDRLEILVDNAAVSLRIAGTLPAAPAGRRIGAIDIAGAQWRLHRLGKLTRIDLKLAPGVGEVRARSALAALLPADAQLVTRTDEENRTSLLSRAYRVNLDMLAMMALFTGGFLVYSTQSLSVARRRGELALLRVIGVTRGALMAQMLFEGGALGFIGSVLGLVLGWAFAAAALAFAGGDLGGGYFAGTRPPVVELLNAAPAAALVFFALGLAAAALGSLLPAREAASAQPAVALKSAGDAVDPRKTPDARWALLLLAAGGAAALLPPIVELPVFGYLAMALLLFGGIALMPWLARALLQPLGTSGNFIGLDLALKRLWGAPKQAAIALCGIVASASLMVAMAVMISSFRQSVDDWLGRILPADLYVRVASGIEGAASVGFDAAEQAKLSALPGISRAQFQKAVQLKLAPGRPPVALIVRSIDAIDAARTLPMIGSNLPPPPGAIPIWVSEAMVDLYGYRQGQSVALPIDDRPRCRGGESREARPVAAPNSAGPKAGVSGCSSGAAPPLFWIAGVWRDYARQHGAIVIGDADYIRLTGDAMRTDAAVVIDERSGATPAAVIDRIRNALPPALAARAEFAQRGEIRAQSLKFFDRSFAVTYVLQIIAIGIGLVGVATTFSAQTLARSKEFGMLRHVGVLRRQIVAMLACEGALLGAIGVTAGMTLGLAMSQVLIHVINPQSFHWTMETYLPWPLLAGVAAALLIAASGTAMLAGRQALSQDAVRAVREDW